MGPSHSAQGAAHGTTQEHTPSTTTTAAATKHTSSRKCCLYGGACIQLTCLQSRQRKGSLMAPPRVAPPPPPPPPPQKPPSTPAVFKSAPANQLQVATGTALTQSLLAIVSGNALTPRLQRQLVARSNRLGTCTTAAVGVCSRGTRCPLPAGETLWCQCWWAQPVYGSGTKVSGQLASATLMNRL